MLAKSLPWKLFMALLSAGVGIILFSTLILYNTTLSIETANLQALSQSHARLIDSVAQFDSKFNTGFSKGGARGATLRQISNAHFEKIGFGHTGEFVVGEIKQGRIHFLIPSRVLGRDIPSVDLDAEAAEPMRRALHGRSGVMYAPDYQGRQVVAWYEPLPELNAGFVAKINISEIRQPFINAAAIGFLVALVVSVLSCVVFSMVASRVSNRTNAAVVKHRKIGRRAAIFLTLVGCLIIVGASSVGCIIGLLYGPGVERQKSELMSLSAGMTSLIEAVADFDAMTAGLNANSNAAEATISQVKRAAKSQPGFGATGEIVLGVLNGINMEFVLPSRFTGTLPSPIRFEGIKAEPMRRALSGKAGLIEDLDYRGKKVIAAFHPVPRLEAGLIAKMDYDEIRSPYLLTGIINISLAIFIVLLGVLLAPQIIAKEYFWTSDRSAIEITQAIDGEGNGGQIGYAPVAIIGLTAFVFLLDYLTPIGVAAGIPYIALIIICAFFTGEKGILNLAFVSTLLVFVGWGIAPDEGTDFYKVITNRLYAVFTIWLAAIIILRSKKSEEATRQSEIRLFSLIQSAPDATLVVASDGRILFANQQAEKLFGYSKSEFGRLKVDALVPKDVAPRHAELRADFLNSAETRSMGEGLDLLALNSSGDMFPVEISLSPIETDEGKVVTASIRDITERKQVEQRVRESEARLRSILEISPFGVSIISLETNRRLYTNTAMVELFGAKSLEQLLNMEIKATYADPADMDRLRSKTGDDFIAEAEIERVRVDGTRWWCLTNRRIIEFEGENALMVWHYDVTERKLAEEKNTKHRRFIELLHRISIAASEAATIESSLQTCLDEICVYAGWPVGHVYLREGGDEYDLTSSLAFHLSDPVAFEVFRETTVNKKFRTGEGLPGRALQSGAPVYVSDLASDPDFPRGKLAKDIGVKAGFAFPMTVEGRTIAVLEFFSAEAIEPDQTTLDAVENICRQLGGVIARKQAEGELASKEAQLRMAMENMPGSMLVVDSDLRIVAVNETYKDYFGDPKGIVRPGALIRDVLKSEIDRDILSGIGSPEDILEERMTSFKTDRLVTYEDRSSDGRILQLSRMPAPNGHTVTIAVDITDQKRAEREIEAQRAQLDDILSNISQGVVMFDQDQKMIGWNARYPDILNIDEKMLKPGLSLSELTLHIAERGDYGNEDPKTLAVERAKWLWSGASRADISFGDNRSFDAYSTRTPDGGLVITYTDITERKNAEQIITNAMQLINESIQYASRIQRSVLPSEQDLQDAFADHIVIWEPKDVVGGDIYLHRKCDNGQLVMLADCTGHGVPGAFMTMITTGAFDQALLEHPEGDPAELLKRTNQLVKNVLGQDGAEGESDDGFECGLCRISDKAPEITYAGARFELWCLDNNEFNVTKGDKVGIGYRRTDADQSFVNHVISVTDTAAYYMTSDGLVDQIGGERRRAFGKQRLKGIILDYSRMNMAVQAAHILRDFEEYQHTEERRDDISLIGFRLRK